MSVDCLLQKEVWTCFRVPKCASIHWVWNGSEKCSQTQTCFGQGQLEFAVSVQTHHTTVFVSLQNLTSRETPGSLTGFNGSSIWASLHTSLYTREGTAFWGNVINSIYLRWRSQKKLFFSSFFVEAVFSFDRQVCLMVQGKEPYFIDTLSIFICKI